MGWAKYHEDIMDAIYERESLTCAKEIRKLHKQKERMSFRKVGKVFCTEIGDVYYDFEKNEVRIYFKVNIDETLLRKLQSFSWKRNKLDNYWSKSIKKKNIEYARDVLLVPPSDN